MLPTCWVIRVIIFILYTWWNSALFPHFHLCIFVFFLHVVLGFLFCLPPSCHEGVAMLSGGSDLSLYAWLHKGSWGIRVSSSCSLSYFFPFQGLDCTLHHFILFLQLLRIYIYIYVLYKISFCLFLCLFPCAISSCAQELHLTPHTGILPDRLRELYGCQWSNPDWPCTS